MKEKRGLSHVEAILSFVIFVGFLVFALIFLNPLDTTRVLDSSLSYSFNEISNNISAESEEYTVILKDPLSVDIIKINLNPSPKFDSNGVRVEDQTGNSYLSSYLANTGEVVIDRGLTENIFVVKFGEEYETNDALTGEVLLGPENYTIASSEIKEDFSENKINDLKNMYDNNYLELKEQFNIPGRIDFSFLVVFDDGTRISAENQIPENVEVFASKERKEIIRANEDRGFADLFVRVW